jgi:hypothetical protein
VIIALYRDTIREWRTRPRLKLDFHAKKFGPLIADVELTSTSGGKVPSYWLRLLVTNGKHRRTASDVSILVTEAQRIEGTTRIWAGLDTVPLIW